MMNKLHFHNSYHLQKIYRFIMTEHIYYNKILYFRKCVFLYAVHDSTLIPLAKSLGIYDKRWPPYCSAVEFELYESSGDNKMFVKVIYCDKVS